jgi:hypothetical protein
MDRAGEEACFAFFAAEGVEKGLRTEKGGIWGKACGVEPINDRAHQVNAFNYILKHRERGAFVWSFRDQPPKANG